MVFLSVPLLDSIYWESLGSLEPEYVSLSMFGKFSDIIALNFITVPLSSPFRISIIQIFFLSLCPKIPRSFPHCLGSDNRCQTAIIISCSTLHPAWALTLHMSCHCHCLPSSSILFAHLDCGFGLSPPPSLIILPWVSTSYLHLPRLFPCLIIHPLLSMRAHIA